jgi:hypothetical protein
MPREFVFCLDGLTATVSSVRTKDEHFRIVREAFFEPQDFCSTAFGTGPRNVRVIPKSRDFH